MSEVPSPFPDGPGGQEQGSVESGGQRRDDARTQMRGTGRRTGPLWGALILIVLGAVMLLENLGLDVPILRNWWAFFILIPVVSAARRAQWAYQRDGNRVTGAVVGPLVGALALLLVMLTLLFDLSWSLVLPIALILVGLGALTSAIPASRR